jgi:hypothetical protein
MASSLPSKRQAPTIVLIIEKVTETLAGTLEDGYLGLCRDTSPKGQFSNRAAWAPQARISAS